MRVLKHPLGNLEAEKRDSTGVQGHCREDGARKYTLMKALSPSPRTYRFSFEGTMSACFIHFRAGKITH